MSVRITRPANEGVIAMNHINVSEELERLAEMMTSGNVRHQREIGDLIGWCERFQTRLRALAAHTSAQRLTIQDQTQR